MIDRVDTELARLRELRWSGPDRNKRVERFLKERLHMENRKYRSRLTVGVVLAAVFAGGAVAGGVTQRLMSRWVILEVSDEGGWEVEVPEGAEFRPPNIYIDSEGNMHTVDIEFRDVIEQE